MRKSFLVAIALAFGAANTVVALPVAPQDDVKAEFEQKKAAVDENDAEALFELSLWAEANGLKTDYKRLLRKVIKVDKNHRQARELLGYVEYDGRWVTKREMERLEKKKEEAAMEAKGLRKYEGEWYPAAEVEKMEKGLFKVEVNGEEKWVTRRDKERIEQGLVQYKGQWITAEEKANVDKGLFKVGDDWLTEEEANGHHASLENPWEIDGTYSNMITTCERGFGNKALVQAKKSIERSYQVIGMPMPEEFAKINLMMVRTVDDYNAIGQAAQDDMDAAMSSSYGCFSFEDPNSATYVGVVHFTVLDESQPEKNEQFTQYLVRHAAAEAAIRNVGWNEELPRWFVTGTATYVERYWDPFNANGVKILGAWSAQALNREGGLMKLQSFFEPFTINRQTLLQSGLLISYLTHGQLPESVSEQWEKVKGIMVTEDQKGLAKEFLRLESVLAKEEKAFQDYADSLLR